MYKGKFRYFIHDKNTDFYEISVPEKKDDQAKLAALLHAFSYGNRISSSILFISKDSRYDITSRHKMHTGNLQKKIEKICNGNYSDAREDEEKEKEEKIKRFYIRNIEVTEDQYKKFYSLNDDERGLWSFLSSYAEKDFSINKAKAKDKILSLYLHVPKSLASIQHMSGTM